MIVQRDFGQEINWNYTQQHWISRLRTSSLDVSSWFSSQFSARFFFFDDCWDVRDERRERRKMISLEMLRLMIKTSGRDLTCHESRYDDGWLSMAQWGCCKTVLKGFFRLNEIKVMRNFMIFNFLDIFFLLTFLRIFSLYNDLWNISLLRLSHSTYDTNLYKQKSSTLLRLQLLFFSDSIRLSLSVSAHLQLYDDEILVIPFN